MNQIECKICGKKYTCLAGLSGHIKIHNFTRQQYYDKFLRKNITEGKCLTCGKDTKFIGTIIGYRIYCSCKCTQLDPNISKKVQESRKINNPNSFVLDLPENIEKMKLAIKISDNQLVCQICNKQFNNFQKLTTHVMLCHKIHSKTYYDYFFKKENEGICYCGKETNFINFKYNRFCSLSCAMLSKETQKKMRDTCKERTGFEFGSQSIESKLKSKLTNIKRTGYDNPSKNPGIQQKKINISRNKYGTDYVFQSTEIKQKIKDIMIEKHGVTNISYLKENKDKVSKTWSEHTIQQNENINKKREDTYKERSGYNNPLQNPEIQKKVAKTNIERYGGISPLCSKEIQEKGKRTSRIKYNYDYWTQSPNGRKFLREKQIAMIKLQEANGEDLSPNIGGDERECLKELQKYIEPYTFYRPRGPIIGYYPESIVSELKLEIEFDEKYHFIDEWKTYRSKDIQRDIDLAAYYGFIVYRIKQINWINDKQKVINDFKTLIQFLKENLL